MIYLSVKRFRIILGITGSNGAGKGMIVEYLVNNKEFEHLSASGLITQEIIKRNIPINRDNMIMVGNDLRAKFGAGYIAEELLKRAEKSENNVIIESIRTLGEVKKLKEVGGLLVAVEANQKLRYKRILLRGGSKDGVSFKEFMDQEKREKESDDPNKQNLLACKKAADYLIENNGSIEELNEKIEKLLIRIKNNE